MNDTAGQNQNNVAEFISPLECSACQHCANAVLRVNLPFLMGRRDAAFDRFYTLFMDCLSKGGNELVACCSQLQKLAESLLSDCRKISKLMSSTDSIHREKTLSELFLLMYQRLQLFCECFASTSKSADCETADEMDAVYRLLLAKLPKEAETVHYKIMRYREYAAQSFSEGNAKRYGVAYDYYVDVFSSFDRDVFFYPGVEQ